MDNDRLTPTSDGSADKTDTAQKPEAVIDERTDPAFSGSSADSPRRFSPKKLKSKWKERETLHWPPGKKEWIIFIIIALVLGVTGFLLLRDSRPETAKPIPKVAAGAPTVSSTLTGLPVDPSVNKRTVTGVMIENSPQARPQAGLGQAGVVFEAIAEYGITRFLALYQDTAPDNIGPVRSARPYYVQWNQGFDAGYAHVGGSPEALADIKAWGVRDLDQFYNSGAYHRVGSRAAPHNVYTSIAALNQLEVSKGYNTSTYSGFARKKKAVPNKKQPPAAKSINLALSGPTYNVHYDYDAASNSYGRNVGGAPHIDANTNQQIKPAVVIALVTPYSLKADGYHSDYAVVGSGAAYVFQDGNVLTGNWTKKDNASQLTFTDAAGKAIKLNPGYTWLTAVSGADRISYTP
jgi:hypothetical protein